MSASASDESSSPSDVSVGSSSVVDPGVVDPSPSPFPSPSPPPDLPSVLAPASESEPSRSSCAGGEREERERGDREGRVGEGGGGRARKRKERRERGEREDTFLVSRVGC